MRYCLLRFSTLEKRYGLLSADFYHLYKAGELEQSRDFIQWVGYDEAKLKREARYRQMMYAYLRDLRQSTGLGALRLAPQTVPTGAYNAVPLPDFLGYGELIYSLPKTYPVIQRSTPNSSFASF
jgi:hypothetical protein